MPPGSVTISAIISGRRRELKLDMSTVADSFTAQLQNAERPAVCPRCLHVFAKALSDAANESMAVSLLKSHHDFFTACARVASQPGATGGLSALRRSFDANATACPNKGHHAFASSVLADSVACAIDALCQCLCAAVSRGSQKKHKKILLSKNGMWPSTVQDLIPTDVKAYARWACTIPTHSPIAFFSRLLVVTRRRVMEDLACSPSRDRICATMVRALRLWRVPDTEFRVDVRRLLAHDVPLGRPPTEEAGQIIFQVFGLFVVFEGGPDRTFDDFRLFSAGYERILHDAIIDMVGQPGCPVDATQKDALLAAASKLCATGNLPVHRIVQQARDAVSKTPGQRNIARDGLNMAHTILIYLQQRRDDGTCSGPGCTGYAREGENGTRALALCGNCQFLRYCSPECQKRDWAVGSHGVPHKVICSALCKFEAAGVSLKTAVSMDAFSDVYFDKTTLTNEEFTFLAQWTLLDERLPREFKVGALKLFMKQRIYVAVGRFARSGVFPALILCISYLMYNYWT